MTFEHDLDDPDFLPRGRKVVIEDYVFIGIRAIILPGVTIHEGAAVAAGAIVTHDVEPYTIVAGTPAKPIRKRNRDIHYTLVHRKFLG